MNKADYLIEIYDNRNSINMSPPVFSERLFDCSEDYLDGYLDSLRKQYPHKTVIYSKIPKS